MARISIPSKDQPITGAMLNGAIPRRRFFLPLAVTTAVPVVLLVVTVAGLVYLGLVRQSRSALLGSKRAAAEMVVRLTTASVMPAVVFNDPEEIQRAIKDLARNPDVTAVELWSTEGADGAQPTAPLAQFYRGTPETSPRKPDMSRQSWLDGDSVRVIEPVVNLEGKTIAAMSVRFSTAPEMAALASLSQQILWVAALTAVCLAGAIVLVMARLVLRPVQRLQLAAQRLARGEALLLDEVQRSPRFEDEVVRLAECFTDMAGAVHDREKRLGIRNRELKLILDSVKQGFITALPDGSLLPERSAIVERWTGPLPPRVDVATLLALIDPNSHAWIEIGWSQLIDGLMPLELAIDQLPKRLEREGQYIDITYHPVLAGEELDRLVIVLTDVTAEVERQRTLAEQQEFSALVEHFLRDRRGFQSFWSEAQALVGDIVRDDSSPNSAVKRSLHTLKGNAGYFGLNRISRLCHDLESAMEERRDARLTAAERAQFTSLWNSLGQRIESLMQGNSAFIDVSPEDYERLLAAVRKRVPFEELEELLQNLRRETVAGRLERAKHMLEATCAKLGKARPAVEIQHDGSRLPATSWTPFWNVLAHVLTNAADHGLEGNEEREAAGKVLPGRVWLSAGRKGEELVIEVRDDGRGLDWKLIEARAREAGLPHGSRQALMDALMTEGFTLKNTVSEISGRGVGMAAVRSVVHGMGGRIEVESEPGRGTAWRFRFHLRIAHDPGKAGSKGSTRTAALGA